MQKYVMFCETIPILNSAVYFKKIVVFLNDFIIGHETHVWKTEHFQVLNSFVFCLFCFIFYMPCSPEQSDDFYKHGKDLSVIPTGTVSSHY